MLPDAGVMRRAGWSSINGWPAISCAILGRNKEVTADFFPAALLSTLPVRVRAIGLRRFAKAATPRCDNGVVGDARHYFSQVRFRIKYQVLRIPDAYRLKALTVSIIRLKPRTHPLTKRAFAARLVRAD